MNVKEKLYAYCLDYVLERMARIEQEIASVQASANEETKSSAGDKYETGRSMAQREVEMNTQQLTQAKKLHMVLLGMTNPKSSDVAHLGSLVTTTKGIFFIAISIGAVIIEQQKFFVVSPESPIGKLLIGKRKGESATWNGTAYAIQSVQ